MADDPIQTALDRIVELDAESTRLKAWVNEGDRMIGREPRFADVSDAYIPGAAAGTPSRSLGRRWQPGDFFNKPFQAAVRSVLLDRYAHEGLNQPSPASVDEIHESLTQGSFNFGSSNVETQKNSIRISLGKNTATFVRLPNSDLFGLCEWYGKKLGRPRKTNGSTSAAPETDGEEAAAEQPAATETEQETEGRETQ
jgi:hypothetical protein